MMSILNNHYYNTYIDDDEVVNRILTTVKNVWHNDLPSDSDGQLIVHTKVFRWEDGSYHSVKEPAY